MPHIRDDETVARALTLSDLGTLDRDTAAAICGVAVRPVRHWRRE